LLIFVTCSSPRVVMEVTNWQSRLAGNDLVLVNVESVTFALITTFTFSLDERWALLFLIPLALFSLNKALELIAFSNFGGHIEADRISKFYGLVFVWKSQLEFKMTNLIRHSNFQRNNDLRININSIIKYLVCFNLNLITLNFFQSNILRPGCISNILEI